MKISRTDDFGELHVYGFGAVGIQDVIAGRGSVWCVYGSVGGGFLKGMLCFGIFKMLCRV